MTKPAKPNSDTTEVWVRLNLVHRALSRRFETTLRHAGLPAPTWYDVLWALERAPDGLRQFELQRHCLYDQPNLSRHLKRMIEGGLVAVSTAQDDRRGRILRLTACGRDLRARMWSVYSALMLELIEDRLSEVEARGLIAGLKALHPADESLLAPA